MSPDWFAPPTPDATIEITASRVSALALDVRGGRPVVTAVAAEGLHAGAVTPAFATQNVHDATGLSAAIAQVTGRLGTRVRRVALVIPDGVARVSLVRLEQVPSRREDLAQLIQWQVRKGVPFPADEARVSFVPASTGPAGYEFLATVVRAGVVAEYEQACARAGLHAGIVDTASTAVINLRLSGPAPAGDWLLVHIREDACAVAVLRGDRVLFFRSRSDDDRLGVGDFVHQAVMYYQDRLEGRGFQAAYLAGGGADAEADAIRREVEDRLGAPATWLDPEAFVTLPPGASSAAAGRDVLTPLAGMALRALDRVVA
ncbi:MAG: type IV pilus biogenesis protein PilM [Vicinamibacterales bacterium]